MAVLKVEGSSSSTNLSNTTNPSSNTTNLSNKAMDSSRRKAMASNLNKAMDSNKGMDSSLNKAMDSSRRKAMDSNLNKAMDSSLNKAMDSNKGMGSSLNKAIHLKATLNKAGLPDIRPEYLDVWVFVLSSLPECAIDVCQLARRQATAALMMFSATGWFTWWTTQVLAAR
jgi:mannitol-specific phosphotransferase system IIBC component